MVTRGYRTHNMQRKTRAGQEKMQNFFDQDMGPWLNRLGLPSFYVVEIKNAIFRTRFPRCAPAGKASRL